MTMSFTQQAKKEISAHAIGAPCCVTAACYGVACFAKYFDTRGIVLHTEKAYIAQWAKAMYQQAGIAGKVYVRAGGKAGYEFSIKDPYEVEKMLALFAHTGEETTLRLRRENILCEGCFAAFTAAAFMCCGVVVNPEKGYALEFVAPRYTMTQDFESLLQQRGFTPKMTRRNGANVLYLKSGGQIEELLNTMKAPKSALDIKNLKIYKGFRNEANRVTNCETANIDKQVAANRQVLAAIDVLEKHGALAALPEPVRQAASLRRANPELSLAELAEISQPPVSKSGLSHRFRKLCDKAAELENNRDKKIENKQAAANP